MRIALLWPHVCTVYHTLPLSLGLLYDTIRDQGHTVRMFNLPLEGWTADSPAYRDAIAAFQPDLIGASAWPMAFPAAVAAVRAAKERVPGAVCVLGGNYASLNPDEAYDSGAFDYLVMGEAERTFPAFVRLLAAGDRDAIARLPGLYFRGSGGRVVKNKNVFHADMDALGRVDYEFIELDRAISKGYLATILGPRRKVAMFATRGCEYACNFCTAPIMNGKALRHYSVGYLTREIQRVYDRHGVRMIYLMDDNATQDRAFFKDLCRGVIALGLRDLVLELHRGVRLENLDPEMLGLMKQAGFKLVTLAPESGSERVRNLMKKNMASDDIRRAARMVKDAGLWLQAYFIVGYPTETKAERAESYRLIEELELDLFDLHKFIALPGTSSFLRLVKQGQVDRHFTSEGHFMGDDLPNFNGDKRQVDREIWWTYARFYLRHPTKIVALLHLVATKALLRTFIGMTKAALPRWGARPAASAPSAPKLEPTQASAESVRRASGEMG